MGGLHFFWLRSIHSEEYPTLFRMEEKGSRWESRRLTQIAHGSTMCLSSVATGEALRSLTTLPEQAALTDSQSKMNVNGKHPVHVTFLNG